MDKSTRWVAGGMVAAYFTAITGEIRGNTAAVQLASDLAQGIIPITAVASSTSGPTLQVAEVEDMILGERYEVTPPEDQRSGNLMTDVRGGQVILVSSRST